MKSKSESSAVTLEVKFDIYATLNFLNLTSKDVWPPEASRVENALENKLHDWRASLALGDHKCRVTVSVGGHVLSVAQQPEGPQKQL